MAQSDRIIRLSSAENVDMADEWYDIATLNHFWMQWRFSALLRLNRAHRFFKGRFLEIGCGNGAVMQQLETVPDVTVDGGDLNLFALKAIPDTKGQVYLLDIFDEPQELLGKYSGILLLDVIEHIDEGAAFLKTSCDYVEKNGFVVINVPALESLRSKYDDRAGHKRRYTTKSLRTLMEDSDIEVLSVVYWGFSLVPFLLIRKLMMKFTPDEKIIEIGFAPVSETANRFFKLLMKIEQALFRSPPLGTSVMAIGRKK